MKNFWEQYNSKILALAPMAGVTDSAFRQICASFGANLLYSEMASVDALHYSPEKTIEMLYYSKMERPYIVQLFGANPKFFENSVKILDNKINPDGYDINFGCPVKKIIKQGSGAALMANLPGSKDVIKAVLSSTDKPLSVKIRTKSSDIDLFSFLDNISSLDVKAVMIHGRTLNQGFSGAIDTEAIKKVKENYPLKVLANGGINSLEEARRVIDLTKADGVGLARGVMGNPWLFKEILEDKPIHKNKEEIFLVALEHSRRMHEIKGEGAIPEMRKHLSWYMHGLEGASELRKIAIGVKNISDIENLLHK